MAKKIDKSSVKEVTNSLSGLCTQIGMFNQGNGIGGFGNSGTPVSQASTLFANTRWYLISNFRQLLAEVYVEHGIVQTLVDQPVDDAFRTGFDIKTEHLDAGEIEQLELYMQKNKVIEAVMQGSKWARLFGGGGVMVITEQDPKTPFKADQLKEGSKIEFRPFDLWEMYDTRVNAMGDVSLQEQEFYDYYGVKVHASRVFPIKGKEAPSYVRPRLRGWGMSELERLVRSLNQYMKNQDVIFELLDEAKVDVYKIKGFNASLLDSDGTDSVAKRVQMANLLKNFLNALTMDSEDEYEQKEIHFAGLGEMLTQIRQGVAADLKMPITKLFGISAAGFNSGEDDIENYNSMIEGEVRAKVKFIVVDMVQICCQQLFGIVPDDLKIIFRPLRILSAKEEEEVKTQQFNRLMSSWQSGLIPAKVTKEGINKGSLLPVEIPEDDDVSPPIQTGGDFLTPTGEKKVAP